MKFVIQHNLMSEQQLSKTKRAVEPYPHVFVGLIPFSHEITSSEPIEGTNFIPYGSTLMTNVTKELGWRGLHFDLSKFNYEAAMSNRGDMLNGWMILTIEEYLKALNENIDPKVDIFIRPSEDLKQFAGQVMNAQDCLDWLTDVVSLPPDSGSYYLPLDTKIVVDFPKNIQAEWRWFIVDGKVVSGSMYRRKGQLFQKRETDEATIHEAQQFADGWLPDPCCVMDLALVNNEVKVIEFNCINSSGFYDNDVDAIFKALYDYHT